MNITLSWDNDGDYDVDICEDDYTDYFADFYGIDKDTAHSIVSDYSLEDVLYDDDGFIEFLKDRYYDQCHDTTAKDDEKDWEDSRL